jgi:hypothetical protein
MIGESMKIESKSKRIGQKSMKIGGQSKMVKLTVAPEQKKVEKIPESKPIERKNDAVFDNRIEPVPRPTKRKNETDEAKIRLGMVIRKIAALKMNGKVWIVHELNEIEKML